MAIIQSSRKFEGAGMSNDKLFGSTLKPGVPSVNFKDAEHAKGAKLFILGSYKQDSNGDGVWYKVIRVRNNFGMDIKEKFVVPTNCPVQWFATKVKTFAPGYAAVQEVVKDGNTQKIYPSYGSGPTYRVLFNVAYVNDLSRGAAVLDVPQWKCAEVIDEWCKDPERPMINDYQAAIPVTFKMEKKGPMPQWTVLIAAHERFQLPEQLADSEYLHNLDEVVLYPNKQELYDKLRMITPVDIFNRCMEGYQDEDVVTSRAVAVSQPAAQQDDVPYEQPAPVQAARPARHQQAATPAPAPAPVKPAVAPSFTIPKANRPAAPASVAVPAQPAPAQEAAGDDDGDEAPPAPTLSTPGGVSKSGAVAFLRAGRQAQPA